MQAWLEQADESWRWSENTKDILDHQGRVIAVDTGEKRDLSSIAELTGKYVVEYWDGDTIDKHNGYVAIVSDMPLYNECRVENRDEIIKYLEAGKSVRVLRSLYNKVHTTQREKRYGKSLWFQGDLPGFVLAQDPNDQLHIVHYDLTLWERLRRRHERDCARMRANRTISVDEMYGIAGSIANAAGITLRGFRGENFLIWLLAGDQLLGRRAVNKLLRNLARRWTRDAERYERKFGQWVHSDVLEKLNARLRAAVRTTKRVNKRSRPATRKKAG